MSYKIRSRSISGMRPKKQIQNWIDPFTNLCARFDVDPPGASSFAVRISCATVSRLKLCRTEMSQHRIMHTDWRPKQSECPHLKILFQTCGASYFEQDGRQTALIPGDCLAYDASRPHVIISSASTRHELVIVPNELLLERGFHLQKMPAFKRSARSGTGRIARSFMHAAFEEATKLSTNCAIKIADSLLDLLLLAFREVDTMSDRVGHEARCTFFPREHLRPPGSARSIATFER
jgi:AraC family transcriptional activator of tynA and feaB